MATHKDAIKRMKQNEVRRQRNRAFRTRMRNQIKKLREVVASGDANQAQAALRETVSVIHRTVAKGIIHRNQGARRISRLNKAVKAIAR